MYKCQDNRTGEVVAIKKLKRAYESLDEAYSLKEVAFLKTISHQNVIELKRVELERGKLYLVFEYLEGGNLTDFMRSKEKIERRNLSE